VIHELKNGKNTVYTKLAKLLNTPNDKAGGRRQEAGGRRYTKFYPVPSPQSPVANPSYNFDRETPQKEKWLNLIFIPSGIQRLRSTVTVKL
jgi:hypothetical protein